ncbi:MAG: hypothetical protein AAGI68_03055 [Planctomycetota bacterium]
MLESVMPVRSYVVADEQGGAVGAGTCVACGYDLAGLVVADGCPECGCGMTAVEPARLLDRADPRWVSRLQRGAKGLRRGVWWFPMGVTAGVAAGWAWHVLLSGDAGQGRWVGWVLVGPGVTGLTRVDWEGVRRVAGAGVLGGSFGMLWAAAGLWRLCTPEPGIGAGAGAGSTERGRWRVGRGWSLRLISDRVVGRWWTMAGALLLVFGLLGGFMVGDPLKGHWRVWDGLICTGVVVGGLGVLSGWRWVYGLAVRSGTRGATLATAAVRRAWRRCAVAAAVIMLMGSGMAAAEALDWRPAWWGRGEVFLWALQAAAGVVVLVMGAWWWESWRVARALGSALSGVGAGGRGGGGSAGAGDDERGSAENLQDLPAEGPSRVEGGCAAG